MIRPQWNEMTETDVFRTCKHFYNLLLSTFIFEESGKVSLTFLSVFSRSWFDRRRSEENHKYLWKKDAGREREKKMLFDMKFEPCLTATDYSNHVIPTKSSPIIPQLYYGWIRALKEIKTGWMRWFSCRVAPCGGWLHARRLFAFEVLDLETVSQIKTCFLSGPYSSCLIRIGHLSHQFS